MNDIRVTGVRHAIRHNGVPIDGVVEISVGGKQVEVPFRASDKGGEKTDGKDTKVWEWNNPEEPMEDVSLTPKVRFMQSGNILGTKRHKVVGRVREGDFVTEGTIEA